MSDRFGPGFRPDDRRWARREAARRRTRGRRRLAVGLLVSASVLVVVLGLSASGLFEGGLSASGLFDGAPDGGPARAQKAPPPLPQLPRGGRVILPRYRVVGFYGAPQADELGVLGIGPPGKVGRKLLRQARDYRAGGRPIMPAFELLATIAAAGPGHDGKYRYRQKDAVIGRYLKAARASKALLVLDIQPGRADFMSEVKHYERWLAEPDVSLALDPEWSMRAGQVPGQQIGWTDAATVNRVSTYLDGVVQRRKLPQKLLLIHQFTDDMIRNRAKLTRRPGVALVRNVDGFGDREIKKQKYREFTRGKRRTGIGYKLFYEEDTNLMQPRDVLRLRPRPDVVVYE